MPSAFQPRFGPAVEEFHRYRPSYPSGLFEHILAAVPGNRRERAMDLGAGTGKSTLALMPHFREVIALEPDLGMAAKLREEIPQAIVCNTTAEECAQGVASVDLVTIGNALHWMELPRVFANIRQWLRPGGILAVYDRPLPKTAPEIDAIVLSEMRGAWKPHRDARLRKDLTWETELRKATGFTFVEETKFPYVLTMSLDDYSGFWRSTSYGSAYARTLADPEAYWRNLEDRFAAAAAPNPIPVDFSPVPIVMQKS